MVDVRRGMVVLGTALGITGCLFPSFDDLSGGKGGVGDPEVQQPETRSVPDPGQSVDAATEASQSSSGSSGSSGTSGSSGSSGSPNTPDASTPPKKFACGREINCELGTQMCCSHFPSSPECRAIGPRNDCEAISPCGDNADCTGAQLCCYNQDSRIGACKATCSGTREIVLCNKQKPGCKSGACNGYYFGLDYCI